MLGAKAIANAKINLFLSVGPPREDGYHEISSVMQSLELSDELYFRRTDGSAGRIVIRCNDRSVPTGEENLVWKAAELFAVETGALEADGIEALINKRIPVGAGLAGGSADAAATLLALDHICELGLSGQELMDMAARVGSDVPFCITGGTALVRGRGEKVEMLEPLPPVQAVLASPGLETCTAEVYSRFDQLGEEAGFPTEDELERTLEDLLAAIRNHDFDTICSSLHNSLEPATIERELVESYRGVAERAGALATLMTGSGPTVFALVTGLEEAAEVAWELGKTADVTIITSFAGRGANISV